MANQNNQNRQIPQTLAWETASYQARNRPPIWYLGFAIVSVGLLAFALYSRSILTIITFALMIVVVFIFSRQSPNRINIKLLKTGIQSGKGLFEYKTIKRFWIIYNPPEVKTLNFETTAYINNHISIELGNQDPVPVKLFLSQYLPEDLEREESVTEVLARKLKI